MILVDEPEISLHIDWQEQLVEQLHAPLTGSRLIIATHSPDIVVKHRHLCSVLKSKEEGISTVTSNVRDRPDEFRRILAKGTIRGKKISSTTPFLHFESRGDMFYCEKFIRFWKRMGEFPEVPLRKVQFVFTRRKRKAIMSHQEALAEGVNVSTLVDMDYDIDEVRPFQNRTYTQHKTCLYTSHPPVRSIR